MTWVAVGSGIVALVGGVATGVGEASKRKGIRQINAVNAQRLEKQAQDVEQQTEEDLVLLRQQLTRVVGEQRAGWGASGLSGDSGSALDVLSASVTASINDRRRRAEAGARQAEDLRYAAKVGDLTASAEISASKIAGASAVASGAGQAAQYGLKALTPTPTARPPTTPATTLKQTR